MIKFFRNIRKKLLEQGKTTNYLKYAIGEIVLVVLGILIALQINNWNEGRKQLVKSHEILQEIRENIVYNNERFKQGIKEEKSVIYSIDIVLDNLKMNKGYHDSLAFHFLNVAYWPSFVKKSSGYATLKSQGVELIKSAELRKAIIDLYEGIYEDVAEVVRISENNGTASLWPMATALFETQPSVPNQPFETLKVTPFDYDKVVKAQHYIGFLSWWRHSRIVSIEVRMTAIEQNNKVMAMIVEELNEQ
jgi:hypothetical protein